MHDTKNIFMAWLKKNNATDIEMFCGDEDDDFDYYRSIDYFIGDDCYITTLMVFEGIEMIDHMGHSNIGVDQFLNTLECGID